MEYPVNGLHASDLQLMRFIRTTQPFFIYRVTKNAAAHTLTVYARHINYLMSMIPACPLNRNECTLQDFLNHIGLPLNIFHFSTDEVTGALTPTVRMLDNNVPMSSLRDFLLNPDYGCIAYYGGEWIFDETECTLWPRKGVDRNITIRYGVDLVDARQDECVDNIVTHIHPYVYLDKSITGVYRNLTETTNVQHTFKYTYGGKDYTEYSRFLETSYHDQTVTATPHLWVFPGFNTDPTDTTTALYNYFAGANHTFPLPGAENIPFKRIANVDLMDEIRGIIPKIIAIAGVESTSENGTVPITTGLVANDGSSDTRITQDYTNYRKVITVVGFSVYFTALREALDKYISEHPVTFPVDITVRSLPEFMTGVKLGDTITVQYPDYGISTRAEIMTMEYDALREQIISYTLGNARTSFAETMLEQDNKISKLNGIVTANNPLAGQ